MKSNVKYNHDVPLQEMKRMYAGQSAGFDAVKNTIRSVFSAAGLILALLGALQVFSAKVVPEWQAAYYWALAAIFALYLVFIVICIAGMWPVYWYPVFDNNWDILSTTFQDMTKDQEDAMYISAIIQAIDLNSPIVKRYADREKAALILFPIIVMLVLSLAFIPRV